MSSWSLLSKKIKLYLRIERPDIMTPRLQTDLGLNHSGIWNIVNLGNVISLVCFSNPTDTVKHFIALLVISDHFHPMTFDEILVPAAR